MALMAIPTRVMTTGSLTSSPSCKRTRMEHVPTPAYLGSSVHHPGWNGGSSYVTRTPYTGHPGEFLKVDDYIMQSALGGNTACDVLSPMPIGTVAHETGHTFGFPDLYDTERTVGHSRDRRVGADGQR